MDINKANIIAHKMVVLTLLTFLIVLPVVSADIITTHTYEEEDMKVRFGTLNSELFFDGFGEAVLKSHQSVNEVKQFGYGKEEVVMWYDMNFTNLQSDGLGDVYFKDMKTGKEVEKDYSFVIRQNESYEVPILKEQCEYNETSKNETCSMVDSGKTETKYKMVWNDLKTADIPSGDTTIGLKTYVGKDDHYDAVWTIAGEKIDKHAQWNASFETGLQAYYALNETSGAVVDYTGNGNDGTNNGATRGVAGIINNSFDFEENEGDYVKTNSDFSSVTLSLNAWVYIENDSTKGEIISNYNGGLLSSDEFKFDFESWNDRIAWGDGADSDEQLTWSYPNPTHFENSWQMLTVVYNDTHRMLYNNGSLVQSDTRDDTTTPIGTDANSWYIGASSQFIVNFDGKIDEVGIWNRSLSTSEISDLYNSGNGISPYNQPSENFTINLNDPGSGVTLNLLNNTYDFNCTVATESAADLNNVSVYYDGVLNQTNSSPVNNTNHIFTINGLTTGSHNWTCDAYSSSGDYTKATAYSFDINFNISGYIKDENDNFLDAQDIFVVNQSDNSMCGNTTSNASGYWTYGPVQNGTYIVTGYDPSNSSQYGDTAPHIIVP